MALTIEGLQKELQDYLVQRDNAQQMYHQLSGAIAVVDAHIKRIKEESLNKKIQAENLPEGVSEEDNQADNFAKEQ